jgi:hypothetical protein
MPLAPVKVWQFAVATFVGSIPSSILAVEAGAHRSVELCCALALPQGSSRCVSVTSAAARSSVHAMSSAEILGSVDLEQPTYIPSPLPHTHIPTPLPHKTIARDLHPQSLTHAPGRRPASESILLPPNGAPKMSDATPRAARTSSALPPPSQSLDNTEAAAEVVGLHSRAPAPADRGEDRGTRVAPASWVPAASLASYPCECLARSTELSRQRRTRSSRSRQSS